MLELEELEVALPRDLIELLLEPLDGSASKLSTANKRFVIEGLRTAFQPNTY